VIGYVGSTGASSGPHLDYQVWQDGVNVNPLDFGALAAVR
jgi:murein DD-endopeptidase MepM/ murein hydrolase activator NlpD